jgi:[protein-PII] uridylyltransferase
MKPYEELKLNQNSLIEDFFRFEGNGFIYKNSKLIDEYFIKSFKQNEAHFKKTPYAIVALGGYGREEQCIYSDIDILFLFEKNVPEDADKLIYNTVSPLWDIGIEVGYTVRTVLESIKAAQDDMETLTSFLDARYVCGISSIYLKLLNKFYTKMILNNQDKLIKNIVEINQKRHDYFGDSAYRLEPNLKEGKGGLRDYHTILWIARIKFNLKQPRDLEYTGCLSSDEYFKLKDSLYFIWNVRNRLHYIAKRKCDQLHMEFQDDIANKFKFQKEGIKKPVEIFLGKLHAKMEFVKQLHNLFLYEQKAFSDFISKKSDKKNIYKDLYIFNGLIYFESSEKILKKPYLLLKIFEESARLKIPISSEAKRLIIDFLYLIDDKIKNSYEIIESFENILLIPCKNFNVLNIMLHTGILEHLIPEIKTIKHLIQYNKYHIFPVDKHSLYTVRVIKTFVDKKGNLANDLCADIYKNFPKKHKKLILWAALLHDIGKGAPYKRHSDAGAEITFEILKAKGFNEKDIDSIVFLVKNHLFLINTATRRDIQDETTAIFCARKIKKITLLKMLYILTVADCIATGPKAWNSWTDILLKDLFVRTLKTLKHGEFTTKKRYKLVKSKKRALIAFAKEIDSFEEISSLLKSMSPRYLLYIPAKDIKKHIMLYNKLKDENFEWEISAGKNSDTRVLTFCGKDRPGLFSMIAGVLTLNGINILDAQIYTWRNGIAFDVFNTTPPPDIIFEKEKWRKAKNDLKKALKGNIDLKKALIKKEGYDKTGFNSIKQYTNNKIKIDNKISSYFTIIEVITYNLPGVLFSITDAIFRCELDIWTAKIASKKDQVMDIFYIREFSGQKLWSEEKIKKVKETIDNALK